MQIHKTIQIQKDRTSHYDYYDYLVFDLRFYVFNFKQIRSQFACFCFKSFDESRHDIEQ